MLIIVLLLALLFAVAAALGVAVTAVAGMLEVPRISADFLAANLWELVAVPAAASWAMLEMLSRLSPRTIFDRRRPSFKSRLGFAAATVSIWIVLEAVGLWLFHRSVPETLVTAVTASFASILPFLLSQHARDGFCVVCNYDLRQTPKEVPCPECGKTSTRFTLPQRDPDSPAHRVPP